ncbi:MAG: N-acetyltransferase [Hyphomicrobiales bacterium]|nr:N-acetyltransferase [Hyphomicrobiales bacterium]
MSALIRAARENDVAAIADILNDAIVNTLATWMHHPFSLENRIEWFLARQHESFPVLVADIDGVVAGYASFGPFRAYDGYARTVEHSVYIHRDFRRRGLGRALMKPLIEAGRKRGDHVMVGAIGLPNDASVALHSQLGFAEVGRMPEVGWKFDAWRDLLLVQKIL